MICINCVSGVTYWIFQTIYIYIYIYIYPLMSGQPRNRPVAMNR